MPIKKSNVISISLSDLAIEKLQELGYLGLDKKKAKRGPNISRYFTELIIKDANSKDNIKIQKRRLGQNLYKLKQEEQRTLSEIEALKKKEEKRGESNEWY